ncbi:MAG: Phosphoglycolate phosphatase [Opitutia bacterium UBA7350]|nr:MAG: Phosphoglycolate phosphatase [Opitutae bacterium UBA7350]
MQMNSRYHHIIWDWNGTLLDDTWLCVEVLNGLLTERERSTINPDEYRKQFGFPVIHFYDYLGFDVDLDSFESVSRAFVDAYEARWLRECSLHSDAESVLGRLSDEGLSHSVLSAAKQETLDDGIAHYGIGSHFTAVIGTDNIHALGKVEQGRAWMARLDWPPEAVVLVGDTLHDLEVAEAIGCDCILMTHGHHCPSRLGDRGVPLANSLLELLDYLAPQRVASE